MRTAVQVEVQVHLLAGFPIPMRGNEQGVELGRLRDDLARQQGRAPGEWSACIVRTAASHRHRSSVRGIRETRAPEMLQWVEGRAPRMTGRRQRPSPFAKKRVHHARSAAAVNRLCGSGRCAMVRQDDCRPCPARVEKTIAAPAPTSCPSFDGAVEVRRLARRRSCRGRPSTTPGRDPRVPLPDMRASAMGHPDTKATGGVARAATP